MDQCKDYIAQLMSPSSTLMDISISAAFWQASQGKGYLYQEDGTLTPYQTNARILFIGSGADEQLGGYKRHRLSFQREGWERLQEELDLDIGRIWRRNLGRDDRILSDHGREIRQPFLDEKFMTYLNALPLSHIVDYSEPEGEGDKKILRVMAGKMGLGSCKSLPKRAIQFGSKVVTQFERGNGKDEYDLPSTFIQLNQQ
eukprot:TRINITY_DN5923_c0_g1_i3.p1 TRINITY_DN5923_c0_g1~~TRINITY_DN5923_c0_g1_i3.p1  ORF type:complete len:200 (-),score=40.97 TRINITY_DN5923_c0_g1_i3:179-778(-)